MEWLAIGDEVGSRSWVEIKGTYIARNVVHDIRFRRHLHVDRPNDVAQFPFVDLQHPFDMRRVACPHYVSVTITMVGGGKDKLAISLHLALAFACTVDRNN